VRAAGLRDYEGEIFRPCRGESSEVVEGPGNVPRECAFRRRADQLWYNCFDGIL
jgi:hypothetical protein